MHPPPPSAIESFIHTLRELKDDELFSALFDADGRISFRLALLLYRVLLLSLKLEFSGDQELLEYVNATCEVSYEPDGMYLNL